MNKSVFFMCFLSAMSCAASSGRPAAKTLVRSAPAVSATCLSPEASPLLESAELCTPFCLALGDKGEGHNAPGMGQHFSPADVANDTEWEAYRRALGNVLFEPRLETNPHLLFEVAYGKSHGDDGSCSGHDDDAFESYKKVVQSNCESAQRLVLRLAYASYKSVGHRDVFTGCPTAQRVVLSCLLSVVGFGILFRQHIKQVKIECSTSRRK